MASAQHRLPLSSLASSSQVIRYKVPSATGRCRHVIRTGQASPQICESKYLHQRVMHFPTPAVVCRAQVTAFLSSHLDPSWYQGNKKAWPACCAYCLRQSPVLFLANLSLSASRGGLSEFRSPHTTYAKSSPTSLCYSTASNCPSNVLYLYWLP